MGDKQFWDIIGCACQGPWASDDSFPWSDAIRADLVKLPPEEIVRFKFWLDHKVYALYTWDHWGAMRLVSGFESDAAFWRFLYWLVGKGKKVYDAVLENPDNLTDFTDSFPPDGEYATNLLGVGYHAWSELGLTDSDFNEAYAALGDRTVEGGPIGSPDFRCPKITGRPFPDDIPDVLLIRHYPRLAAQVGLVTDTDENDEELKSLRGWEIIAWACSREYPHDSTWDDQWSEPLVAVLMKHDPPEIIRFAQWFREKSNALFTERHLDAGRLINGCMNDENARRMCAGGDCFCDWVVGMGQEVYEGVLADPDTLADVVDPMKKNYLVEFLGLVAFTAWERLRLEENPDYIDLQDAYRRPELLHDEWDRNDLAEWRNRYPRLTALYSLC